MIALLTNIEINYEVVVVSILTLKELEPRRIL